MIRVMEELFIEGIRYYRFGESDKAVLVFRHLLGVFPEWWEARLYLAMSLFRGGHAGECKEEMAYIRDRCPDAEIRGRAESSFRLLATTAAASGRSPG